jgi:hypothetical protein
LNSGIIHLTIPLWVALHLKYYSAVNKSVEDLLNDKQLHTALIKKHLAVAQNRIKLHVDKYWTDRDF